ncbi:DUF1365 family protein [Candidatus Bathyarchaeota archaeon]|nr:DUF1365 family protein [Candidatus Bathyarchaeota archaeon]
MGSFISLLSSAALLALGSFYLAFLSCPIDWILVGIIAAVRSGLTITTILNVGIFGLVPAFFILLKPHQYLALLFDSSDAAPTELGKPALFKCRTTHRRLSPKIHSFGYSYLVAGIPVGWKGRAWGILAADGYKGAAWFKVRCGDHLHRGGSELGLRGKLNAYLSAEVSGGNSPQPLTCSPAGIKGA